MSSFNTILCRSYINVSKLTRPFLTLVYKAQNILTKSSVKLDIVAINNTEYLILKLFRLCSLKPLLIVLDLPVSVKQGDSLVMTIHYYVISYYIIIC